MARQCQFFFKLQIEEPVGGVEVMSEGKVLQCLWQLFCSPVSLGASHQRFHRMG